ncbi:hypothetical protein [Caulobacter sp. DWR1-3-2b1]|uniref:hypothetical protein n=1 Tax=Caulobacter sp. DWR1-3-2b1 TaxID=2804670 RepID=UPI003CF425FC
MGEKSRRKAAFLSAHPLCCYCGVAPSKEPDHMPPRVLFKRREAPEGFEFPACVPCNRATRGIEQVVAFYARALDQDDKNLDVDELRKLINGIRNNYPHLMPKVDLSANEKRAALRHRGDAVPPGQFLDDLGIIMLPIEVGPMIDAFAAKLAKALYYREVVKTLPLDFVVYTRWFDFMHKAAGATIQNMSAILPNRKIGSRSNTDIGQQFEYVWGRSDDGLTFGFTAQLGSSIFLVGVAVHEKIDQFRDIEDESERWTRAI